MHPIRILAVATVIEISFASALLALAGLGGAWNGWLDLVNCLAPLLAIVGMAVAAAARFLLPAGRFRRVCAALGAATAVWGFFLVGPDIVGRFASGHGSRPGLTYRVISANVFHQNPSPFSAARSLVQRGADAVIVAESDGTLSVAHPVLANAYPYFTDCDDAGVQIWLKTPILAQGCRLPVPPDRHHHTWGEGFVWARTMGPDGKPITLVGAHLGRPYPPRRQLLERRALPEALAALDKDRLILAGDFNIAPSTFAMRGLDSALAPLRRITRWRPTFPARINLLQADWALPLLPIDHLFAGRRWSGFQLTTFRIPNSDHFGLEARATLVP